MISKIKLAAQLPILLLSATMLYAGGAEYNGQFESALIPNIDDFERVVLKSASWVKAEGLPAAGHDQNLAAGKLIDPRSLEPSVLALLVDNNDDDPVIYFDGNGDGRLTTDEKYVMKRSKPDNPYLWEATVELALDEGAFKSFPIFVRYFKSIRVENMGPNDRLITQSTMALARGQVDVRGKKVSVQYTFNPKSKKVDPQNGYIGVDIDGDGVIDPDTLSPEMTKADNENVVFRAGDLYVSTKKADVSKNIIVLREHEAKEYKRAELFLGREFPEFGFTDFEGKKHKFSEFRGRYVLLDIWGFWCPPCRKELPYLREAHRRFTSRNLVVIGLNTDGDFTVDSMKKALNDNGMNWTHAQFSSVAEFLAKGLRVNSFPTTFLISPEGKILSMGRADRDEPDLRGSDLLETLDKLLPKP